MTIINTTFALEENEFESFLKWLNEVYIKAAMTTGLFTSFRIAKVLTDDQPQVVSIACELRCESLSEGVRWHQDTASLLYRHMAEQWGDNVVHFTTFLKEL